MTPVSVEMTTLKQKVAEFAQVPEIKAWITGIQIKPATSLYYTKHLWQFLDGEAPKAFIDRALKNPREVGIEIKGRIGLIAQRSPSVAFHTRAAVKSFVEFNDLGVHMNGQIKVRRKWSKPYISWEDAEKIISKCRQPYESALRFMLWAGIGADELLEINSSPKILKQIKEQIEKGKEYIIIDLEPRKQTLTRYFTAVPKQYLPEFPILTLDYKIRGKQPVTRQSLEDRFRQAAKSVGVYSVGMGPHTLRSVFTSRCNEVGVKESVCEFLKGHGGGDQYGYAREVLNEEYVVKELRKLTKAPVTENDLRRRDETIEQLRQQITEATDISTLKKLIEETVQDLQKKK
jgi:integrase